MVRTLLIRPMELLRFVWGRTKQEFFRLKLEFSQAFLLQGLSIAGQSAAFLAAVFAIFSDGGSIAPAQAAGIGQQANFTPDIFSYFDFTALFACLAIGLLCASNFALWRMRRNPDRRPEHGSEFLPAQSPSSTKAASPALGSPRTQLERQCQKLALIADQAQRKSVDIELNNRAREAELARLCHDLRTPLNAVIGFSDLMQRETFGPLGHNKYIEYAEHIGQSGHNLLTAVDNIFEFDDEIDTNKMIADVRASAPGARAPDADQARGIKALQTAD